MGTNLGLFGNRMRCCLINFCMRHMTDIDYLAKQPNITSTECFIASYAAADMIEWNVDDIFCKYTKKTSSRRKMKKIRGKESENISWKSARYGKNVYVFHFLGCCFVT